MRANPFAKRAGDGGTYWTSTLPRASVRHYLRGLADTSMKTANDRAAWWQTDADLKKYLAGLDPATFAKAASIGGDQESGFEQAFSSLAYAYLKDKSPRLIDFIIGFQLIDRNEDNTKAVGIFGFKVGDQWLYAPVFFLNGDLKGHELLYIKNQDAFVPMKENWVNYLISRRPHVLGEGSDRNANQLGGLSPNIRRMSRPPLSAKFGADTPVPPGIAGWAAPALPPFFALALRTADGLYKVAGDLNFANVVAQPILAALTPEASRFDMRDFLVDLPRLKMAFDLSEKYPLIKAGFVRFYGSDFFLEAAGRVRDRENSIVKTAQSFIVPPEGYKKKKPSDGLSILPEKDEPEKKAALFVYAAEELSVDNEAPGGITENKPELTEEEREKLLRDTVLIKDERDSHATSIAYNTQTRVNLTNPSETGLHEVLEKPGKFTEMVVIANPHAGGGRKNFCLVLRKDSPKNWKNCQRDGLWVKQCDCPTRSDWEKYVDGLGGVDDLQKGGVYVAVHANGSGTCPFRIREDEGDGTYLVWWDDYCAPSPNSIRRSTSFDDFATGSFSPGESRVTINRRKGTGLRTVNGDTMIPDSYKIIKISDPPKPREEKNPLFAGCCSSGELGSGASDDEPIKPGNQVDVQILLNKQAAELNIHDTGTRFALTGKFGRATFDKRAALVSLVRDHGLREDQAREMLKAASDLRVHNRAAKFMVKYAFGYGGLQPGPSAPAFPSPEMGTEPSGQSGVPSIYPQEEFLPVDDMRANAPDPSTYDPFYQPDQNAMMVAQQASQGGQKEVFDTAMIGSMLKSVRQDSLVDRYLGDLMKALDKLGRILFMFYWHQEEFEDRYGKQDLPELEDSIRNAFEVMGDVVLFLKEKTVGGGPGALNSTGVGSADAGEPNIQEAARN
jgi:hypothetical protein